MTDTKVVLSLLAAAVLFLAVAAGPARAEDCDAVLDQVKQERNLLKQSELLEQALPSCPKNAEISYKYGYTLERLRKYDKAVKYYKKAAKINSKVAKYHFGLADIYAVQGNKRAAIQAYKKGLKLEPKNSRARRSLEQLEPSRVVTKAPEPTPVPVRKVTPEPPPPAPVKAVVAPPPPPVEKKTTVTVKPTEKKKKVVHLPPVTGPTLKPRKPNTAEFNAFITALEKDRVEHGKADLGATAGGVAFKAQVSAKSKALQASAREDTVSIDPEQLTVSAPGR